MANPSTLRPLAAFAALAFSAISAAEETIPAPGWEDDFDPIASEDAVVGGRIRVNGGPYPKSFNYYLDTSTYNSTNFSMMYETLLGSDPVTLEFQPHLAERCVISDDKLTFTFHIDPRAKWSDGRPVTAADVAFTYETIMDPKNLTGPHKIGLETFEAPEVLGERAIRFRAKEVHWRNLLSVGFFHILPRHAFEGRDFNKINFEFPVVSGPYRLGEVREGIYSRLERRDDWWLKDAKRVRGTGNFQTIEYRYYAEREEAFEAFKQQQFDFHAVYTSHIWVDKTRGEAFDKNWIVKQAVRNYDPPSWQGFAMNLRREPYSDPKARLALARLLNRERLNNELMFKQYKLSSSYVEDLYDAEHPNPNELVAFDKDEARRLLKEAGWTVNPRTGRLEKNGKPFLIRFLTRDTSSDKFLVVYKEDLADVGIDLEIVRKDWAAWVKDMDEHNFDMTWAAWGTSVWKDPESQWHSKEADRPSGQNITGFKSAEVDALIEKQRELFDVQERNEILRQIDGLVYREMPYILLWHIDYTRLLYWNKFGTPYTVLAKFGDERSALAYWWIDPDAEAGLKQAMDARAPMAPRPYEIQFDEEFDG